MGGVVLVQTGGDMGSMEAKDGRTVNFYMVIPAYREEIEYKLEYGMEALDKRFFRGEPAPWCWISTGPISARIFKE